MNGTNIEVAEREIFRIPRGPRLIAGPASIVLRTPHRERLGWSLIAVVLLNVIAGFVATGNFIGFVVALTVGVVASTGIYRQVVHPRMVVKGGTITVFNPYARAVVPVGELKKVEVDRYAQRWHERGLGHTLYLNTKRGDKVRVYAAQALSLSSVTQLRNAVAESLRETGIPVR